MKKGFTLIELLVTIAIIAILAVAVFVALDPATRFADARNARRWSDVNSILTAVHQCIVDNGGTLSACGIGASLATVELGTGELDLSQELASYLKDIPIDPSSGDAANTNYEITVDANGIVTIEAAGAESSETIEVSR